MNQNRFTSARIAATWALALGLVAVMLFSLASPAYAANVHVDSVSVGAPSGTVTYGTAGTVQYVVAVHCTGTGNGLSVTPAVTSSLPSGVTYDFTPSQLNWGNGCGSAPNPQNTTLALHTTAATPGGVAGFTVGVGGVSNSTASLTVNGIPLTIQGFGVSNKVYDGTANAPISAYGVLSSGVISADAPYVSLDHTSAAATFSDKFVNSAKLVTAYGFALTGSRASNYSIVQPTTFANITPRDLHIYLDSVADKTYDGTTAAVVTLSTDAVPGDTVTPSGLGSFDTKNVGSHKLVTVPSVSLSGPDAGNYNVVTSTASGYASVTARSLTVTAVTASKQYDGTTGSSVLPQITAGILQGSDTFGFTQHFDTKHVGSGKTLTPGGAADDGNSGNNYVVTFVPVSTGQISARPITVTASADTKPYDGSAASSVLPTATSGSLAAGDSALWSQAFDNRNVGAGKTLTPSGSIDDGNGGADYVVSFVPVSTGQITARPVTVSAVAASKAYDGTAASSASPTITFGGLAAGDTASWSQSYDNRNAGTGKVLTPTGSISDGNGGNNYSVTFATNSNGVISALPITVTAASDNKVYDGSNASTGQPSVTFGGLVSGDSALWSQSFDNKNAGVNKVLTPAGSISDGNGGNNYNLSLASVNSGVIEPRPIVSVTADDKAINENESLPAFTFHYGLGDVLAGDTIAFAPACSALDVPNPLNAGSYVIACSGGSDPNYDFSGTDYVPGTLSVAGVNDPPTAILVNGNGNETPITPFEFQRAGTIIGLLVAEDPNGGDVSTFSLPAPASDPSCADNATFQIGGAALDQLQISDSVPNGYGLDFELQPVLHICLLATDPKGATLQQAFTVNVKNEMGVEVFSASQGASDGFVLESAKVPGNGGSASAGGGAFNLGDNKNKLQYRSILSFNTAVLPDDAYITKVTLKMRLQKKSGDVSGLGNLLIDLKQPYFGSKASLQTVDFQDTTGVVGLSNAALSGPDQYGWYSIELNPAVLDTAATKKGLTQLRLEFAQKTNSNAVADMLQLYSGNSAVAGNRPQLVIDYALRNQQVAIVSTPAQDGQVTESLGLNGTGGAMNATSATFQVGDNKLNEAVRGILSFNTAALPDNAIITGVKLQLTEAAVPMNDPFGKLGHLYVDLKQANFGDKPALEKKDFESPADQAGMAFITPPSTTLQKGTVFTVDLDPSLFSSITPSITTQLRLRFENKTLNQLPNAIAFFSGNNLNPAFRPQLIITFQIP